MWRTLVSQLQISDHQQTKRGEKHPYADTGVQHRSVIKHKSSPTDSHTDHVTKMVYDKLNFRKEREVTQPEPETLE